MTEFEMVRWHHRLNIHEFEQTPGDSGEQRSLACCNQQSCKESDRTQQLNNNGCYVILLTFKNVPVFQIYFLIHIAAHSMHTCIECAAMCICNIYTIPTYKQILLQNSVFLKQSQSFGIFWNPITNKIMKITVLFLSYQKLIQSIKVGDLHA